MRARGRKGGGCAGGVCGFHWEEATALTGWCGVVMWRGGVYFVCITKTRGEASLARTKTTFTLSDRGRPFQRRLFWAILARLPGHQLDIFRSVSVAPTELWSCLHGPHSQQSRYLSQTGRGVRGTPSSSTARMGGALSGWGWGRLHSSPLYLLFAQRGSYHVCVCVCVCLFIPGCTPSFFLSLLSSVLRVCVGCADTTAAPPSPPPPLPYSGCTNNE